MKHYILRDTKPGTGYLDIHVEFAENIEVAEDRIEQSGYPGSINVIEVNHFASKEGATRFDSHGEAETWAMLLNSIGFTIGVTPVASVFMLEKDNKYLQSVQQHDGVDLSVQLEDISFTTTSHRDEADTYKTEQEARIVRDSIYLLVKDYFYIKEVTQ